MYVCVKYAVILIAFIPVKYKLIFTYIRECLYLNFWKIAHCVKTNEMANALNRRFNGFLFQKNDIFHS